MSAPVHGLDPRWARAAAELMRALRGPRSQVAFARRLGLRSNAPAAWEGGHRVPAAGALIAALGRLGVDAAAAWARFHPPAAAAFADGGLAAWLRALRGQAAVAELAARSGLSETQVRRILRGEADPRLHQLLALVDALTGRAPDLVAELVDIREVPSLADRHAAAALQRRLAVEAPWTAAVRVIVDAWPLPAAGAPAALARRLGQPEALIEDALARLIQGGLVIEEGGLLRAAPARAVDLRVRPEDRLRLRAHWAAVGAARVAEGRPDLFSYSLVALSRADLRRVEELQRAFFRELRGIAAASEPVEVAALVVGQVAAFDDLSPPPEAPPCA